MKTAMKEQRKRIEREKQKTIFNSKNYIKNNSKNLVRDYSFMMPAQKSKIRTPPVSRSNHKHPILV